MANILTSYPIRYTQDEVNAAAYGVITSNEGNYLDLTQADVVTGIEFTTDPDPLPMSVVKCNIVFNKGGNWFILDANGDAEDVETQELSAESIFEEGNSIEDLTALTNIDAFKNSTIRFALALWTSDPDNVKPKVKFKVNCKTLVQQLSQTVTSPEYEYDDLIVITGIETDNQVSGGGSIVLQGRYYDYQSGTPGYTEWSNLSELIGAITNKYQFKAVTTATTINVSQSILNNIRVRYNEGGIIAASGGVNEIITVTRDWRVDLRHCRVVVRHAKLNGSSIKCYVTFRAKSTKVTGEQLGVGTGLRQTLNLEHTTGIKLDTVRIYVNGKAVTMNYDVNCQTGRVVLEADAGAVITCDYEYGWEAEEWTELALDYTEEYEGYDQSVYRITLPENATTAVKSIAGIKIALQTSRGTQREGNLGLGDGTPAQYKLQYPIRGGRYTLYKNGVEVTDSDNYVKIDREDARYITVTTNNGEHVSIEYEYESEPCIVYEVSGIFSR